MDALPFHVVLPAVVGTSQYALGDPAEGERGSTVDAEITKRRNPSVDSEDHELLFEQLAPDWMVPHCLRSRYRMPVMGQCRSRCPHALSAPSRDLWIYTAASCAAEMVPTSFSFLFTYWYTPNSPLALCHLLKIVGPLAPTY